VERMRLVFDKHRKLMGELMRAVGFGIPVMPQEAFYMFADASKWTDDSYAFAFELLEKAGVGVAPGVDFGQAGKRAVSFRYASSEENIREAARSLGDYLGCKGWQGPIPLLFPLPDPPFDQCSRAQRRAWTEGRPGRGQGGSAMPAPKRSTFFASGRSLMASGSLS